MPVVKGSGFGPGHPFAGTRVIFDAAIRRAAERQRASDQDPMREAEQICEQFLQERCGDRYMPPGANDAEGEGDDG
jgi:hypothetical protein